MPHIYLKREDLNHTGAHKINNALGQAMLCKRMGKTRIIAETGAGQHGVATVSGIMQPGMLCCSCPCCTCGGPNRLGLASCKTTNNTFVTGHGQQ
jgi:hypothetical protein